MDLNSAVLATNDYSQLREAALAGLAVTELPPFMARESIRQKHLVRILRSHPLPEQQLSLVYPPHRHRSSLVRAYIQFFEASAREFLGPDLV